nr:immunoglobulin heavy chain junction region [Macaca mulatta]
CAAAYSGTSLLEGYYGLDPW